MDKIKVLFVCIHNSARSQMAEAFLNELGKGRFEAESAGWEAGKLNPLAIEAMKEADIDISKNRTKEVFDFYQIEKRYNYIITVCDESNAERCPIFPDVTNTLHWLLEDPSGFKGTPEEKLEQTRKVRDLIKEKVKYFIKGASNDNSFRILNHLS